MNKAIITTFTQDFWKDFVVCYDSIKRVTGIPIYVAPLEFDQEHRAMLKELDVEIIEFAEPEIKQMKLDFEERWVQWSKAYLIRRMIEIARKELVLWLDVDLVVLDSLDPIFERMEEDFVVINDYFAPKACLNDEELYKIHPAPIPECQKESAINSGVLGFKLPRDEYILDSWLANTKKVIDNPNLQKFIRLYDQGVLLWTMRDLKIIDKALPYSLWNHKAKRNCYEYSTKSAKDSVPPNFRWPEPKIPRMGGDIIDEVQLDNPGVTIAHFAGLPKLWQLTEVDHPKTKLYASQKFEGKERSRVFCVGLERCGTHTIAEAIRRSVICESWVRHEFDPVLAREVELKMTGQKYWTPTLSDRMKLYNRRDTFVVCESNHRLGFFVPELASEVTGSRFLLLLRDPISLLRSRFRNYSFWARHIERFPEDYTDGFQSVADRFDNGSVDQNSYRIRPMDGGFEQMEPAQMHAWEIITTLRYTLNDLKQIDPAYYSITWIENVHNKPETVERLMPGKMDMLKFNKWVRTRFGMSFHTNKKVNDWIEDQINKYSSEYVDQFLDILREYDISPPFVTYI